MHVRLDPTELQSSVSKPADGTRFSFDDVLFVAALAALAWVPLWFGSERSVAWGINAVLFGTLVIAYEISLLFRDRNHAIALHRVALPAASLAVVVGWCLLQASTAVPAGLQNPVWQLARDALDANFPGSISVNRDATLVAVLRLLTAASVFWLMLQLCRSSVRARLLVEALTVIGLGYAIYGIVAFFALPDTILWFSKVYYLDSLTSTFVNRNTYATYASIGFICALAKLTSVFVKAIEDGEGRRFAALIAAMIGPAGLWLAMASVIGAALVLTGSRGGIAAALSGVAAGAIIFALRGRKARMTRLVAACVMATMLVGTILISFGDLLAARLSRQGLQAADRVAVYELTLQSIADRPWLGFGYGTFEQTFPMYRDARLGVMRVWDRAHNTYLEVVQGLGVVVSLIFFLGVGLLLWRCFLAALKRRRSLSAPLAASAVSVAVLLHAFVDFSLQSQAVAVTWIALVGAGVAQSWSSRVATET